MSTNIHGHNRSHAAKQVGLGGHEGLPYLEAVMAFNIAVYIFHTYLDFRQLKVSAVKANTYASTVYHRSPEVQPVQDCFVVQILPGFQCPCLALDLLLLCGMSLLDTDLSRTV